MSDLQERRAGVYTVGVALKKEKARKHIRDELVACALANGIRLVLIDEFVPLEEQGPFDAILQKIRRPGMLFCCARLLISSYAVV